MTRPSVDVVVPFLGSSAERDELVARLGRLRLRAGDTVTVADNGEGADPVEEGPVRVVAAPELPTPAYARNRAAAQGRAPWLVFIDADVSAPEDLLDLYFADPPGDGTALVGGGVVDEPVDSARRPTAAERYATMRRLMSQDGSFAHGRFGFPQTANCACRREAFEAVGGFREELRAAEDADLAFRLQAAGWKIERREDAAVTHHNRQTVRELVQQQATHGAGMEWLNQHYPGSPRDWRWPGLVRFAVEQPARGVGLAVRRRDFDELRFAVIDVMRIWAYELGRRRSNLRAPREPATGR